MLTSGRIIKLINENNQKIKKFGVKRIGLFGSYATNNQKSESDIDVLVEFEKGKKTFDNYMDLKFYLEDLFGCNVDLVVREALKLELKRNILKSVKYATGL
jgi:predicted nucleotidyltransferase